MFCSLVLRGMPYWEIMYLSGWYLQKIDFFLSYVIDKLSLVEAQRCGSVVVDGMAL